MVFVHHTDTPNGYAPDDVPAIIRSIYTYHVRSNGWNDIGYNFLVDAYGRVFEGRAGGIDRPVIGAHTEGFNAGSVGIAVIGNGSLAPLTAAAREALTNLIAWRLDVAHVDPLGHATMISGGSDRFAAGKSVSLRVVSGHRDANATDCPGALIYPELDGIAAAAQATGTPKIVDATRDAARARHQRRPARSCRSRSTRASSAARLDRDGARRARSAVASTSGSGARCGLDLERRALRRHDRRARDAAGVPHRGARRGRRERPPVLASLGVLPAVATAPPLSLAPAVISPDGDGVDDSLAIGYTLAGPATVKLDVIAPDGSTVDTLVEDEQLPAGGQSARWAGESLAGPVADGTYTVRLTVTDAAGSGGRAQRHGDRRAGDQEAAPEPCRRRGATPP